MTHILRHTFASRFMMNGGLILKRIAGFTLQEVLNEVLKFNLYKDRIINFRTNVVGLYIAMLACGHDFGFGLV